MDPLEEQLAKLKLMNDYPLPPRVCPEDPFKDDVPATGTFLPIEVSPKKIGPAVPPKPNKKTSMFPEVPQSIIVKQICEPLYSKRLQSDSVLNDMRKAAKTTGKDVLISGVPVLHRKSLNYTGHNIYSNNKITLDNPAILDQQLEALEYHKKQLEKKGLLQNTVIPKLSTASYGNGDAVPKNDVPNANVYSNIRTGRDVSPLSVDKRNEISNVYSNLNPPKQPFTKNNSSSFVYSNVHYGNNDDLPPPPHLEMSCPLTINDPNHYLNQCSASEEDIPPPPSPVSSSYSELRRATDIFPKLPSYPIASYRTNTASKSGELTNNLENSSPVQTVGLSNCEPVNQQQTYINVGYHHNDYGTYGSPNSQKSFSQSASDYYGYGSSSQGSSTYESIYEPINPRPPSQLSVRSNYLQYAPYVNSPPVPEGHNTSSDAITGDNEANVGSSLVMSRNNGKMQNHKEVEVETLTDLLVHSMDTSGDSDSFGICVACNERIVGENSGCTAMDQVYHIACFTCSQCQINLQGKPFYALDAKPYCESDYLNTLEKCSVCMKPILERILRATGKPYHPQCFTCVVCGNSLDGIPFTVDATNQNYCIADFHKKFAPRCCVCKLPIMPEPGQEETVRVVALDRSFHFECYKCEDCGLLLSSEAEGRGCYPLDDHVLCKSCNAKRVQMLTNRMTTEL